jgi:hypothetical protein
MNELALWAHNKQFYRMQPALQSLQWPMIILWQASKRRLLDLNKRRVSALPIIQALMR